VPFRRAHEHRETGGQGVAVVRELASRGVKGVLRVDDPRSSRTRTVSPGRYVRPA